jgi:hypothetical protein
MAYDEPIHGQKFAKSIFARFYVPANNLYLLLMTSIHPKILEKKIQFLQYNNQATFCYKNLLFFENSFKEIYLYIFKIKATR